MHLYSDWTGGCRQAGRGIAIADAEATFKEIDRYECVVLALTWYQPCRLGPDGVEHRNGGGQILFIEFCDWAIKTQLCSQDFGGAASPGAKGVEAGHVRPAAQEAVTPSAAGRSSRPRSAARDRPTRATPSAVSKSQEYGGTIEKHSDYRC